MAQWLTVWRAAHLVGVPRGVLQQRVRAGELQLADGLVSTDALLRLYPEARLEECGLLERVAQIRDEAFGRRLRERLLPSQEVLAHQALIVQTHRALESLTPREAEVLRRRYGLHGKPGETLRQIGEDLHLSHERVRQIEAEALSKLRHQSATLRVFLEP